MRADAIGMFWEDLPEKNARGEVQRVMPAIPETGWVAPKEFPRLDSAPAICLDTETYDPDLLDHGPGWARGKGHIVGISLAVPDTSGWYFPIRHTIRPEENLPVENVLNFLRDTLTTNIPKIGANLMYDLGWLLEEGVDVRGDLYDVQFAEALLDETAPVSLDALGEKYLGIGKTTEVIYQWCSDFYGGAVNGTQRKNLWRAPPSLVGPYAIGDVELPLKVLAKQWPRIQQEGLTDLFRMENDLIYLLLAMRRAGVGVNVGGAEVARDRLNLRAMEGRAKLKAMVGFDVNINASDSLAKAFDSLGISYNKTAKGRPSFTKDFLETVEHPAAEVIREIRKVEKLKGTFLESYIIDSHVDGKVHGQFHLLRGDSGGTRSGRLSSSTPNLQNLPSRDEELAPLVRGIFVPDEGHKQWVKIDYSQIEYRFMIHFALGKGAEEARNLFNANPDIDYHEMTLDLVAPVAGWDISTKELRKKHRKPIKNINFGLIYGMGVEKLSKDLGLSVKEGKELFQAYHIGVPFAKPTMDAAMEEASRTGVITTILGRKSRFDLYEPVKWGNGGVALPYEKAIMAYGNIRRAYTHKALNRRLQGSAADLMKKAMWRCWKEGIFDHIGVPRLTVHDELDFSDPGGVDDGFLEMKRVLEEAITLRVPVRADMEVGPDWGHVA